MARASIIELFNRVITYKDKRTKVYLNGENDSYPSEIRRVIQNSVTATAAAKTMSNFILGKGPNINPKVNRIKGYNLYDIAEMAADDIAEQKGVYFHVNYDVEGNVNYIDVLDYEKCRVAKEDDMGYSGMIYYWPDLTKTKEYKKFYPFNPDMAVINAQRIKDSKDARGNVVEANLISKYRGQVLFLNLEPKKPYPLAYVDPVFNDADSEFRVSEFKNTTIRKGFIGKVVATVLKADNDEDRRSIDKALKELLGSENSGNLMKLETEVDADGKLMEVIKFEKVDSNIDDKLFAHTESSIQENILTAFNNVPKQLVMSADSALFSSSGEALREMQLFYQSQTRNEREKLQQALQKLTHNDSIKITPLIEEEKSVEGLTEQEVKQLEAQATLKGSVGGVQGILAIQQNVANEITTIDSALSILNEIFGINEETARAILGSPKIEEDEL